MGRKLVPQAIDVPLSVLDQTPPKTAGPIGRLTSLRNAQITKYLPATATPGVATGARVKIEQREAFRSLPTTIRSSVDGSDIAGSQTWSRPELLDSLDDQTVAICDSVPRVYNGSTWTGYPDSRVVARQLSQKVMHTIPGIMQVPSGAWLNGVTCAVWTQTLAGGLFSANVGFMSDNGTWLVTPAALYTGSSPSDVTMAKVVSDGSHFFVFFTDGSNTRVTINVYDTNGVRLGQSGVALVASTALPGFWDVTVASTTGGYTVMLAMQAIVGSDGVKLTGVGWNGSSIITSSNVDTSIHCVNVVAFMENDAGDGLAYLLTTGSIGTDIVYGYRIASLAQTHEYITGITPNAAQTPDSLIGWVEPGSGGADIFFAVGSLNVSANSWGPEFDPRNRLTGVYHTTFAGVTTTVKLEDSVLPVSRAMKIDDDWYCVGYYQGGPGITAAPTSTSVSWTSGDFMRGPAVQPLSFSPGDWQFGNQTAIPISGGIDNVSPNAIVGAGYQFNSPPPALLALGQAYIQKLFVNSPGHLTISGAAGSGNNGTFQIRSAFLSSSGQLTIWTVTGGPQVAEVFSSSVTATLSPQSSAPDLRDTWVLGFAGSDVIPDASWIGEDLYVAGTSQPANFGSNTITDAANSGTVYLIKLGSSAALVPEVIANPVQPTAVLELRLADPTLAYSFHFLSFTFDPSYVGATIAIAGSGVSENDTVYQITQYVDAHTVIAMPIGTITGQVNREFPNTVTVAISKPTNATASDQPTWFLLPLSAPKQHTAGRWEYGLAYSDWRFDGQSDPGNRYPCNVASVSVTSKGLQILLPFRAESFSAGVTSATGNPVDTFFSTIGLKAFTIETTHGQSLAVGGELIIPGPQASEFTSSSFAEHGINLGPEAPFLISQANDPSIPVGMTPGTAYQVRIVFEATDENGDRIFTPPSPPLNFVLQPGNNTATYGGNVLTLTQRNVTIAIYRTSIADGQTTVQHYKITNDTDPNGTGFSFPTRATWNFVDNRPDSEILVSEVLYTDKGFLPRYPAPAFKRGVGTWRNRTWVIGYDDAVWLSGEKSEGDAIWFHPALRVTLPVDDEPAALAALDDYMLVLGSETNWYIPSVQFPDATGNNPTSLPAPVQLPFANGCTGHAVTTRDGVIYSSTAGGAWLIPRNLTNDWLSQPIQLSLGTLSITGLSVDSHQRVAVSTGNTATWIWDTVPGAWYEWDLPSSSTVLAVAGGLFTYLDGSRCVQHSLGNYADNLGASDIAVPPSWSLAPVYLMGSVRGYGRCWKIQLEGEYLGAHYMNLTLGYGDEVDYQPPTVFPPFLASPTLSYLYEWNPQEEEASAFELSFSVTFPNGVAGNSATWELLSFEVGVDSGLARIPANKRISAT